MSDIYQSIYESLKKTLVITDYNLGYEKTYMFFKVTDDVFGLDWEGICNSIPTTRSSGLTPSHVQIYMQVNGMKFVFMGSFKDLRMMPSATYSKLIKHTNVGNY